jgi:hypothetical protein
MKDASMIDEKAKELRLQVIECYRRYRDLGSYDKSGDIGAMILNNIAHIKGRIHELEWVLED